MVIAFIAPLFIPESSFKKPIIRQIETALGRNITVNGPMQIRLLPFASIYVQDVTISGFPGKPPTPLMELKSMRMDIAVLPLLRNEIAITDFILNEPQINLEVNKLGKTNWQSNAKQTAKLQEEETKETDEESVGDEEFSSSVPEGLAINNLDIHNATIRYTNQQTQDSWDVQSLNLQLSMSSRNSPLSLEGNAKWRGDPVKIQATLASLEAYLSREPTELTASMESSLAQFATKGTLAQQEYKGEINIESGSTDAHGSIQYTWGEKLPNIFLDLATEKLDLNDFLPEKISKQGDKGTLFIPNAMADNVPWSNERLDFSALQTMNATVKIKTGAILYKKLTISNTTLNARLSDGILSADIMDAGFYDGKADIKFTINSNPKLTAIEKSMVLKNVQAEPFLKDALESDRFSGITNMQVSVTSQGSSEREFISNLQGSGQITFTDGAIKGVNLADMVRNIQSAYKEVNTASQKTDFAELGGTFTIANGVIHNNDLAMKAPLMRLSGSGQVSLPNRTIDYRLRPQIVDTLKGQGSKEKEGLAMPVIVEGSLDNPRFRPDVKGAVEDAIRDPEKFKEQLKDTKDVVKDLKGLLKKF